MSKSPVILLTFDVEEFDLPQEYKLNISVDEQMEIGRSGTVEMNGILERNNVPATLFTTANFASHCPHLIAALATKNEIASHSYYHTGFEQKDLVNSINKLQEITGKSVTGLRMPRFMKIDCDWVKAAGFKYDSSINPTFIPGRYDNRHLPKTIYKEEGLIRVPVSVTPNLRLPLFWMAFKNLPYEIYKKLALKTLAKDGYLSLYFHPWEFTDITKWKIPFYIKKDCVNKLTEKLERLIIDLKKEAEFKTISDFLSDYPIS